MRIPKRLPIVMKTRTALGGLAVTAGMAVVLLSLGAQIPTAGHAALHVVEAALGASMLVAILFAAWGIGRGTWAGYRADLKARTAAGIVAMGTGVSGSLLSFGFRLGDEGRTTGNVIEAALATFMLGIMLFTAWNIGRGFRDDDRDDGGEPRLPVPPLGGQSLKPKHDKIPETVGPPRSI